MENRKDALVTKMYYGLDGFPEMNYRQIGEILKVTGRCIEQRVKRAIRNIKKDMEEE